MRLPVVMAALCSLLLASSAPWAQDATAEPAARSDRPAKHQQKRERTAATRITAQMERDLALSSEQTEKVRKINETSISSLRALTPTEEEIKRSRRQQREILATHDKELRAVLSETQYADYTEKKERYEKRLRNMQSAQTP